MIKLLSKRLFLFPDERDQSSTELLWLEEVMSTRKLCLTQHRTSHQNPLMPVNRELPIGQHEKLKP